MSPRSMAQSRRNRSAPAEFQIGCAREGFVRAIERFDADILGRLTLRNLRSRAWVIEQDYRISARRSEKEETIASWNLRSHSSATSARSSASASCCLSCSIEEWPAF